MQRAKTAVPPQFTADSRRAALQGTKHICLFAVTGEPGNPYTPTQGFRALLTNVFRKAALSAFTARGLSEKRRFGTSFAHRIENMNFLYCTPL